MNKIIKGDEVVVLTGRNKGARGTVLQIVSTDTVIVENVNLVKKHTKPNPQAGEQGGIVEKEAAINISNIAIYNPATGKSDRVGIKVLEDGKKVRYFKSNNEVVDI
ncbi:MAG: 50S ribosomal protein L24 [Gammaproteobacteria bacterium]